MAPGEVTVLMPHRNHGGFLPQALANILGQTAPANRIIIVDDASDDGSREVLRSLGLEEPRLKVLYNDQHLGVAKSVNRGLDQVDTEFLLLASADDRIMPHMIETLRPILASRSDAPFCASAYAEFNGDAGSDDSVGVRVHGPESDLGPWFVNAANAYVSPDAFRQFLRRRFVWLSATTCLFRTRAFRQIGAYHPELRWHADWLAIYALAFRYGFFYSTRTCAEFRVSPSGYSAGMRSPTEQSAVVEAIFDRLAQPDMADVRAAIKRSPGALAPFIRRSILTGLKQPRDYGFLGPMLLWWSRQYARRVRRRAAREMHRWSWHRC